MHCGIHTTDAHNLLLHVYVRANHPDNDSHGVPKYVGENVFRLLCVHSSACKPHCVSFTKFIIKELRFS